MVSAARTGSRSRSRRARGATRRRRRRSSRPSCSSTSAEPQREVTERLPCLATGRPAAAATKADRGRDVDRARSVAAGAAAVGEQIIGPREGLVGGAQRARRADQLVGRLALHPQRDQHRRRSPAPPSGPRPARRTGSAASAALSEWPSNSRSKAAVAASRAGDSSGESASVWVMYMVEILDDARKKKPAGRRACIRES